MEIQHVALNSISAGQYRKNISLKLNNNCGIPKLLSVATQDQYFCGRNKKTLLSGLGLSILTGMAIVKSKITNHLLPKVNNSNKSVSQVLDKKTGKLEELFIDNIPNELLQAVKKNQTCFENETISAFVGDKEVGRMAITSGDKVGFRIGLPDNLKSLYIEYLATSPDYKGVGKELIKNAVHISRDIGCKGNVDLYACTGGVPTEYLNICGQKKCHYSSALIYRKLGFYAVKDRALNKKLDKIIKNKGNGMRLCTDKSGDIIYEDKFDCPMRLSAKAIKKYLK